MHTRNRRSTALARPQRRKLVWSTFNQANLTFTTGQTRVFDLISDLEVAGASKLGVTIMRTHLSIQAAGLVAPKSWQLGLSITRSSDVGGGFPSALTQPDIDWMLNRALFSQFNGATVNAQQVWEIDLRAKRKCEEMGDTYCLSFTNGDAASQVASFFSRVLLALP